MTALPDWMLAARLVAPKSFEVTQVPIPGFRDDEVLIAVQRCGICGTDVHMYNGHYAADRLPLIPGHEFSGTIAAIGPAVEGLRPGQKVVVDINMGCGHCFYCRHNQILNCAEMSQIGITRDGGFAEFLSVPSRFVIPASEGADFDVLALTEPVACVVRAARRSGASFGQSAVVIGAGPIGNLHVQMMRLLGLAPVIVLELDDSRGRIALESGADVWIQDPNDAARVVADHTDGRGADLVIESVGIQALYELATKLVRPGGHVAAFGLTASDATLPLNILRTVLGEYSIAGSVAGMGQDMHDAVTLLSHSRFRLDPFVGKSYPLLQIGTAFEELKEHPEVLKVQITMPVAAHGNA